MLISMITFLCENQYNSIVVFILNFMMIFKNHGENNNIILNFDPTLSGTPCMITRRALEYGQVDVRYHWFNHES